MNLPQKSVENAMKRMYVLLIALFVLCGCREAKKETKTSLEPTEISNISEELVTEESTTPMNVTPVNKAQGSTAAQNLASQTVVPAKEIASAAKVTEKITEKQSGPSGKDIQQALKNAGIYSGKVDGVIGAKYKGFATRELAEAAYHDDFEKYLKKDLTTPKVIVCSNPLIGSPVLWILAKASKVLLAYSSSLLSL